MSAFDQPPPCPCSWCVAMRGHETREVANERAELESRLAELKARVRAAEEAEAES